LGRDRAATDACIHCYRQKRITSASIMVFMEDSERAAELAVNESMETGLHVNLVLPYDSPGISESLRKFQNSTAAFFRWGPWTQVIFNPFIMSAVTSAFNSQLEEYRRLFRREPAHFNGHKHFHLSLNMIGGEVLPLGSAVRRSFTFSKGDKSGLNRWYRRLIDARLLRRHISTDAFFSLNPVNDLPRLTRIVNLAHTNCVELMVHPWSTDQFEFLVGKEFGILINKVRLGGFAAIQSNANRQF
jgi:predicted glycoside hydrolase/deacetylase ChbG (UPF0249 family)